MLTIFFKETSLGSLFMDAAEQFDKLSETFREISKHLE